MQLDEPIQSLQLIIVHFAVRRQDAGLLVKSNDATLGLCRLEHLFVFFCLGHASFLPTRT